jgi:hypothetical protein
VGAQSPPRKKRKDNAETQRARSFRREEKQKKRLNTEGTEVGAQRARRGKLKERGKRKGKGKED